MSIDKLKSIAERSERECEHVFLCGADGKTYLNNRVCLKCREKFNLGVTDTATTDKLRAALNAAIKVIEVLSAANELADDQMQYYKCELVDNPTSWNEVIEKVRQARQDAEEIMRGVAE